MAHPVNLLVNHRFFFNKGISARHIGFGLVVVVITDKIFNRIMRKKTFHLGIELCRQRFVGREDKGGALQRLNDMRHGKRLARAGDAQQHLINLTRIQPLNQLLDRGRLIPGGLKVRHHLKRMYHLLGHVMRRVLNQRDAVFSHAP